MKKIALAALMALIAAGASAEVYVGGGVGRSKIPSDCPAYATCKDSDTGTKFYGGYQFNPAIAGELGYLNFGKATVDFGGARGEIKAHAVTLAMALRGDLAPSLAGVARLGLARSTVKETSNFSFADSGSSSNAYLGLGLEYAFNRQLKGTLAFDTTHGKTKGGDNGNLHLFTAGLQYGF